MITCWLIERISNWFLRMTWRMKCEQMIPISRKNRSLQSILPLKLPEKKAKNTLMSPKTPHPKIWEAQYRFSCTCIIQMYTAVLLEFPFKYTSGRYILQMERGAGADRIALLPGILQISPELRTKPGHRQTIFKQVC
jgi:hypothetical protein